MPPQRPTMSAAIRGFGKEGFDRESLKTSRQNAPSFSNGLLRANKLVTVVFPRHANKIIMCHADVLRFWSPKLRILIDESAAAQQEILHTSIRNHMTTPEAACVLDGPMKDLSLAAITLCDVQPRTFSIFLDWAYSGTLPDTKPLLNTPAPADTDDSESDASFYFRQPEAKFLEAYIFGRRYHIRDFRNDMFDCLYEVVTWRKVGKEGDGSGNLVPSHLLLFRALVKLELGDPICFFLTDFASLYAPTGNPSQREIDCAFNLREFCGVAHPNAGKGPIRKGPSSAATFKNEQKMYCIRFHEHLGNEHADCWANMMASNCARAMDEDGQASSCARAMDEDGQAENKKGSDSDTYDANSKMDEDTEEEKDDADVSMDEDEDEQELPIVKSFSVWGCDEAGSEDWDVDYENTSSPYDSSEFKEDDVGEDEDEEE